jgi:predicted nucleotidyltransferase
MQPRAFDPEPIIQTVLSVYPETQAIYLFGSYATGDQHAQSDLDLALLLPPESAHRAGSLYGSDLHHQLEALVGTMIDCVNLRLASTVFQHEITSTGCRIFCNNLSACIDYEALVLSLYQKLNEERAEIIAEIYASGRVYAP